MENISRRFFFCFEGPFLAYRRQASSRRQANKFALTLETTMQIRGFIITVEARYLHDSSSTRLMTALSETKQKKKSTGVKAEPHTKQ